MRTVRFTQTLRRGISWLGMLVVRSSTHRSFNWCTAFIVVCGGAFLCGQDPLTGRSFDHRRSWIRHRLEFLASVFAIDCLTFSVMSNHVHQILRTRPDVAASWSDRQVATRWLTLHPVRRNKNGSPITPTPEEIDAIENDPQVLAERRRRLSDVSWWMRSFSHGIACQANREDGVKGHFWESRYKAKLLLDEAAVLAAAQPTSTSIPSLQRFPRHTRRVASRGSRIVSMIWPTGPNARRRVFTAGSEASSDGIADR